MEREKMEERTDRARENEEKGGARCECSACVFAS